MKHEPTLLAGAAAIDITPERSLHLAGYPFVQRNSTGVHDPLLSSALYLSDGISQVLFIGNDVIYVPKELAARARKRIYAITGVPESNIMVSATHTHSGPSTVTFTAGSHDALLPPPDKAFLHQLEEGIVNAAVAAFHSAMPALMGLSIADATGIGTNRHDPLGPKDLEVPVLMVQSAANRQPIGCMLIVNMHPTVLHEDSTLYSGDFPGCARRIIQEKFTDGCPVIYHIGAAGNQSPRHVTKENSFNEAQRIGNILAQAVGRAIDQIVYSNEHPISTQQRFVDLPRRSFPGREEAEAHLNKTKEKLDWLKSMNKSRQEIRTAEVNWFGAVETLHLAKLWSEHALDPVYTTCIPAEIQVFHIGPWTFVGWQGEIFIEYWLAIKKQMKNTFLITLANGELQGYIVTPEAARLGVYEASNAIFDHTGGEVLVNATLGLIKSTVY
jgi:Neutral/alkaline non-lysosomal ceramidase.